MHARQTFRFAPLVAALLAAAGNAVAAEEPNPYFIGLTETLTHDGNIYRIPGGPSGNYSSTGLIGGFDQSFGRQHFSGSGNIRYNKYFSGDSSDSLDNTSYGVSAGWDWSTLWNLSGSLNLSAGQSLASYGGNATVLTTSKNILRTDQVGGSVRYGGAGRLSLGADYAHSRVHYSAPESQNQQSYGDSGSVGLYYNVSPDITTGVAYRLTSSTTPNGQFVAAGQYEDLSSHGRNIDLTLNYHYSVQTNFSGRLSFTHQTNSGAAGQGFSGITGGLTASYMPTGKIGLTLSYARDAGTNGNFFNVPATAGTTVPTTGLYQNSQTTDSLTAGLSYAATAKIATTAGLSYRRGKIVGTTNFNGTQTSSDYTDSYRTATLGFNYAALRWASIGCNYSHETRSVSAIGGVGYSDNIVACTFTATLR